jgi:hypothetical protein
MGKISYSRYMLIPQGAKSKAALAEMAGAKSLFPMDCLLGLSGLPFKITPCAMLEIAWWAQSQPSYQRAEEALRKAMGMDVGDDTVRLVANFVGAVAFKNDCRRADADAECLAAGRLAAPRTRPGVLYIQADGAALNTRHAGEDGSTWRENKLGEVFSSDDIRYWTDRDGARRHRLLSKEFVSYVGSASEFKRHLLSCALRHGYGEYEKTVFIGDGATWLRNMVDEVFPDAQQILDFFHLAENVYAWAGHAFGAGSEKATGWAKEVCGMLRAGRHREVATALEPLAARHGEGAPVNLLGYIRNNERNLDYPAYEEKGYFIGSGAIESGNKVVLQDRLKRAGMRWNVETAQAMLTLKAKAESGLWHKDVELPFQEHCRQLSL